MKINIPFRNCLRALATTACLVAVISVSAQPADGPGGRGGPGGPGGPGGGRGGRGFGPALTETEMAGINSINMELTAEIAAVNAASSNLVVVAYATPKDEAKIVAANNALTKAREAWATKASAAFAKVQASPSKLSEAAIAQLIASAPGGRGGRGGRGGFGGPGGPGGGRGPGGPGGGPGGLPQ